MSSDYYAVLGVLPGAEDIVITAAYRALAQRYHPDKWRGDPAIAHERMSLINEAYAVLGDPGRRATYDSQRDPEAQAEFNGAAAAEQDEAFDEAMSEIESRWEIACTVYEDLPSLRARLKRISTSLAFTFVMALLETKAFERRIEVAKHLEQQFLERFFGANPRIVDYGRGLILHGLRDAAKELNKLVDVLGSDANPDKIMAIVDKKFGISAALMASIDKRDDAKRVKKLIKDVQHHHAFPEACELLARIGYQCIGKGGGFFASQSFETTTPSGMTVRHANEAELVQWVRNRVIPDLTHPLQ